MVEKGGDGVEIRNGCRVSRGARVCFRGGKVVVVVVVVVVAAPAANPPAPIIRPCSP